MKNFIIYSSLIVLLIAIVTYIDNSVNIPKITPYPQFKSRLGNHQNTISIMTYNIRFNFLDSNKQSWEYRKEKLLNNIKLKLPDILSIQEDTFPQLNYLAKHLSKNYSYVTSFNDVPELLQHNCIFYNKEKFIPVYNKTIWLNEKQKPNELGWDGWCPRSTTIAIFKTRANPNEEFVVINAHLDHRGRKARVEGTKQILSFLKKLLKERYPSSHPPIFFMGDLNESPKQAVDSLILKENFTDMWLSCQSEKDCAFGESYSSSFHYYFGDLVNNIIVRNLLNFVFYFQGLKFSQYNRYHIDHMYYLNGNNTYIQPLYASMPSDDLHIDQSGIYASDHFPLFGVFKLR